MRTERRGGSSQTSKSTAGTSGSACLHPRGCATRHLRPREMGLGAGLSYFGIGDNALTLTLCRKGEGVCHIPSKAGSLAMPAEAFEIPANIGDLASMHDVVPHQDAQCVSH